MNPQFYSLKHQTANQISIPRGVYDPKDADAAQYFGQHNSILYQAKKGQGGSGEDDSHHGICCNTRHCKIGQLSGDFVLTTRQLAQRVGDLENTVNNFNDDLNLLIDLPIDEDPEILCI